MFSKRLKICKLSRAIGCTSNQNHVIHIEKISKKCNKCHNVGYIADNQPFRYYDTKPFTVMRYHYFKNLLKYLSTKHFKQHKEVKQVVLLTQTYCTSFKKICF